jgi:peptidoglycan hydrolase CwlO-like protein
VRTTKSNGVGFMVGLLIALSLLMSLGAITVSYQAYQQFLAMNRMIEGQQQDFKAIQQSLAIVDEDSDQSRQQISQSIKTLISEVDKLWASAWRRNQKEIGGINKELRKYREAEESKMREINASIEKIATIEALLNSEGFADMVDRMGDIDKLIKQVEADSALVNERLKNNEVWVSSINEWRREANQRLLRLRDSIYQSKNNSKSQSAFEETPL